MDRGEKTVGPLPLALIALEPCKADRGAQLPKPRALISGHRQRPPKGYFGGGLPVVGLSDCRKASPSSASNQRSPV